MTVLCSLKNLSLTFGDKTIFSNASFQADHGDKIGLIGLNGKGKSSLFKILTGELEPDSSTDFVFDKASAKQGAEFEYSVFLVEQAFTLPKTACSARDYVFFYYPELKVLKDSYDKAVESENLDDQQKLLSRMESAQFWDYQNAYESYLKAFELEDIDRDVDSLSGGEQKKVLLALGLISKANLVLWDEPTNHLDIETVKKLEDELNSAQKTFIIISHDRHLLSKVCNKITHIHDAKIDEFKGSYAQYLEFLGEKEEQRKKSLAKLKNTLKRETEWMRQGVRARGTRSKKRVENFENLTGKVQTLKNAAKKEMELSINNSSRKTKKLAAFKDMSFGYTSEELFSHLDVELYKGEKIGVLGPNGAGKTTLMKLLKGDLAPTSGEVFQAEGLKVNFFDQKREELNVESTPFKLLGAGEDFVTFSDGRSLHVSAYFENFLFDRGQLHRPLSSFSGGELNRLQLAINLKNESDIWIFDEPTNDLDIESIEILEDKLSSFKGTVLIISHDRTFLENVTNKIWVVKDKGLEKFNSGYSQVQAYLEALELEESLLKDAPPEATPNIDVQEKSSRKLSNKEKERLKKIPSEIATLEKKVVTLEEKLAEVDYASLDTTTSEELSKMTQEKEECEDRLLHLYEEMEELESLS